MFKVFEFKDPELEAHLENTEAEQTYDYKQTCILICCLIQEK